MTHEASELLELFSL